MGFTDLFSEVLSGIEPSAELKRIIDMPKRDPEALGTKLAPVVTRKLRHRWPESPPKGTPETLRWYQALALVEANRFRGALIPLPVGAGKTILTGLLPTVLGSRRPVLLVPAKLREKTKRGQLGGMLQGRAAAGEAHLVRLASGRTKPLSVVAVRGFG